MCYECYEAAGKPATVTPAIAAAATLIRRLYDDYNSVGGNLHIVVADWNVEDHNLASCREEVTAVQQRQPSLCADTGPAQVALEAEILDALEPMTERERYTVVAMVDGFFGGISQVPEGASEPQPVFEDFPYISGL